MARKTPTGLLRRREAMLGLGQVGLGALTLPGLLSAEAAAAPAPARPGRAKSCILIFLWGGPPQQDMWDMKPDAPEGIRSLFQPISTSADGIQFCEHLPLLAKNAHRMALVRSVTHGSDEHEVGVYHMLTGQVDAAMRVPANNRQRKHFPGPSGIISCLQPAAANVPASVTLPRPIMHDGIKYAGTHAGWLGAGHDPLELPDAGFADGRPVFDLGLAPGLDAGRLARRRTLVERLEAADHALQTHPEIQGLEAFRQRAFDLLVSGGTRRALDLGLETPDLRDRYGRNHYGESFLLARRLVEAGVRLVTLNWMYFRPDGNPLNPWDNHGGTAALGGVTGYEMLTADYCLPPLDRAYSALLEDLDDRGLLDETLVVAMGEFGRTPKINKTTGRDHWGACQTVAISGAGVRGGTAYGASDADAAYPTENPVSPEDLLATIYDALGIPPGAEVRDRESRPHPVTTGTPIRALF
jgi:hypothetical protein